MLAFVTFICLIFAQLVTSQIYYDYYWRDYTGSIPSDAVPAGHDVNRVPTYIGQAFFFPHFLQVARIYKGEQEVTASRGSVFKSKTNIKILCSRNKNRFKWIPVNGKTMHLSTTNYHVVRGGMENDRVLNIGRIQYQGELITGKVTGYNLADAKLFFPYENSEKNLQDFELLVFDTDLITKDPIIIK